MLSSRSQLSVCKDIILLCVVVLADAGRDAEHAEQVRAGDSEDRGTRAAVGASCQAAETTAEGKNQLLTLLG